MVGLGLQKEGQTSEGQQRGGKREQKGELVLKSWKSNTSNTSGVFSLNLKIEQFWIQQFGV